MNTYADFIASKAQSNGGHGFQPTHLPEHLFPFQRDLVEWSVTQGRAAIFADCGMGKTPMELAWAQNVHEHTGKPVLLLTPLAVGFQIVNEATKFGHEAALSRTGKPTAPITVTNYEQLPKFNPDDFPGDVIRAHQNVGWLFIGRHVIWKEPLAVRNRTMQHNLSHKTIVDDGNMGGMASPDELLIFRKPGRDIPTPHPTGLTNGYAGTEKHPSDILRYRGHDGDQKANRYSHWVWRRYASSVWDDVRIDRVLPFQDSKDEDDEKHVHPLQLDVIERYLDLRTNPGDRVLTPFMGVGSEVFAAVQAGRFAIGAELKSSYFKQAILNLRTLESVNVEADILPLGDM